MEFHSDVFIAQLINFLILFFVLKWALGDKIVSLIKKRRGLDKKYEDVQSEINTKLTQAEAEKKSLIDEAVAHKNRLIDEAKQSAQIKAEGIIADANKKAGSIVTQAEESAARLEKDLKDSFVDGVKQTAHIVVKKLFDKDVSLKEEYVDSLVAEYTK